MATASVASANTCVEIGGSGVGGLPPMRGIRGLTCTGPAGSSTAAGTGVDVNTQNFSISDSHFEDLQTGINIGSLTSARGIAVKDITGGGNSNAATVTVVNINSACASGGSGSCQSYATSDIQIGSVYQPSTNSGTSALNDAITGKTTTEATLGFYSLGDGSGSGSGSTRPILATSSSIGSSPSLIGMTSGTPISGIQGNGTLVQMSAGSSFPSGDLLQSDSNSNTADSHIAAANVANTVTFFTTTFGTVANNNLANTTIQLWGFSLPNAVTTSAVVFNANTPDNTANLYDLGIYDGAGNRMVHTGATAGSTLFGSTSGSKTASWSSSATLTPGKYYFATATNCTSACAVLGGTSTGTFASAASGGTATGGALPTTVTPPADSWAVANIPLVLVH